MRYIVWIILVSSFSFAIMPPKYYENMIENSLIKAEAKIVFVKVVEKTKNKIKKEIEFELIKSDGEIKPKKRFKGWCYSAGDNLFVGGEIYYYPKVKERVYVTLATRGGKVTSMKILHIDMQKELMSAILMLNGKSDKKGLVKIERLIEQDPKKFKDSYQKLFLDPSKSKYTEILKRGYIRFVDLMLFKELAKSGIIDNYMQDLAIDYIFFSSYKNFANRHLPFMEFFRTLMQKNPRNNTEDNAELLALFETNYLLSRGRNGYAYRTLKENAPYHTKALKVLSYFSSIKNLPIFSDKNKIEKIVGIKLKVAQFEHTPEFLFDFEGKKYEMKSFQW